jgi:sulfite reductase alpha subunit-like flavoprotein
VAWLTDHLFKRNGVIFICGGEGMAKAVDKVIFQCLRAHVSVAYKAFTLSNKLKEERTIVEEIFG